MYANGYEVNLNFLKLSESLCSADDILDLFPIGNGAYVLIIVFNITDAL